MYLAIINARRIENKFAWSLVCIYITFCEILKIEVF